MESNEFQINWGETDKRHKVFLGEGHGFVLGDEYAFRLSVENEYYVILKIRGEVCANVPLKDITGVK